MKKTILFIITFISIIGMANAQKSKLFGSWLLTKVEVKGETEYPYQVTEFSEDGKMLMMGMEIATWSYNKNKHTIEMKSDFDKDFNGEGKILKLTKKEFILEKDGIKASYKRFDIEKIYKKNATSGLIGTWRLTNETDPDIIQILSFKSPEEFLFIEKRFNTQSKTKGEWIFNKREKNVILVGYLEHLKGLNNILTISSDDLSLENKGKIYSFKKVENKDIKIERLTFSEKDFYDENGDYKYYDDKQKLPWQDSMDIMMKLVNVKQLVYTHSTLIEGTNILEKKILISNVNSIPTEQFLNIDFIFDGWDSHNIPSDTALPSNEYDQYNDLYPLKDDSFRVIGEEEITVKAGTFSCTVIEALGNWEENIKFWMINDKPGIIAKIIKDKAGTHGHYHLYELQEIK